MSDELSNMNDAELMRGAAEAAREDRKRAAHEERLEAYAEGRIDADVVRTLAQRDGVDDDIEDELVAYAPLGEAARDRITGNVVAQVKRERARRVKAQTAWRRASLGTGMIALAASLALFVHSRRAAQPALPAYEIAFVGGEQQWRGEPSDEVVHRFTRGEHLRIDVRPRTAVLGDIDARIYLQRGDEVRLWPAAVQISNAGAVRVIASADALPQETHGTWDAIVAIARPGTLPSAEQLHTTHDATLLTTRIDFGD